MEKYPKVCNICGGKVLYTNNSIIYGKPYGSGKCYICTKCGAYVGTHKPNPKEAMGILANKEMRDLKMKCHDVFDKLWHNSKERNELYKRLANIMNIPVDECHFGYFDIERLKIAYDILCKGELK